ncbi:hypothetical protein HK098_005363, partial [Nowakowskiella sp. JEL0407]
MTSRKAIEKKDSIIRKKEFQRQDLISCLNDDTRISAAVTADGRVNAKRREREMRELQEERKEREKEEMKERINKQKE